MRLKNLQNSYIRHTLTGGAAGGLGLVLGGLVEGIAERASISPKQMVFQLSADSGLRGDGIAAAIRGPSIPSQLELLE